MIQYTFHLVVPNKLVYKTGSLGEMTPLAAIPKSKGTGSVVAKDHVTVSYWDG
jgi:hypothetical protein